MKKCTCQKSCDCQCPPPDDPELVKKGPWLVSNSCPVHNLEPRPSEDCPVHNQPREHLFAFTPVPGMGVLVSPIN